MGTRNYSDEFKRDAVQQIRVRGLILEVRLHPDPTAPGGHAIELFGELGAILALGEAQTTKPSRLRGLSSDSMVAGAGFALHLPTTARSIHLMRSSVLAVG